MCGQVLTPKKVWPFAVIWLVCLVTLPSIYRKITSLAKLNLTLFNIYEIPNKKFDKVATIKAPCFFFPILLEMASGAIAAEISCVVLLVKLRWWQSSLSVIMFFSLPQAQKPSRTPFFACIFAFNMRFPSSCGSFSSSLLPLSSSLSGLSLSLTLAS